MASSLLPSLTSAFLPQIAAKSLSPGEQLSAWRVVAREYGDEQDNLIMETASGVFTWMQVEADSDSEVSGARRAGGRLAS